MCESNEGEIWKPVPGFDGYEASSLGRVRSLKRKTPYVLKPYRLRNRNPDYDVMSLWDGHNNKTKMTVGRIVCLAFHGEPEGKKDASHIDGNHHNNTPENLTWEPRSLNLQRFTHGTEQPAWKRERNEHGHFKPKDEIPF